LRSNRIAGKRTSWRTVCVRTDGAGFKTRPAPFLLLMQNGLMDKPLLSGQLLGSLPEPLETVEAVSPKERPEIVQILTNF
jgi:hypothetical protein